MLSDVKASRRLSHRARGVLPASAQRFVRGLAERWGTLTSRWRMVPAFVIVGAQRSGTTSLFRLLSEHPQVVRPTLSKGIAYFDLHYHRGHSWYRGHFPLAVTGRLRGRGRRCVTFESSGYYMFHPLAPGRIASDLRDVKLVVMLRDPVERAYSAHRHELRRNFEQESFESALDLEQARIAGEEQRIRRDPAYHSFEHQHHAYLGRGKYAEQIMRLTKAVGRERVYVVDAGRFFSDPATELSMLCRWLGLDDVVRPDPTVWNAAPREPMTDEVREELSEHFAPFDKELCDTLGWVPSWRSDDAAFQQSSDDSL